MTLRSSNAPLIEFFFKVKGTFHDSLAILFNVTTRICEAVSRRKYFPKFYCFTILKSE